MTVKCVLWSYKMISIFILPLNHFRNWDAQREELTDAQREKEREKERLIDTQREKDHVVDRDLAFVPIAISRNTAPIVISQSVNRDLAKHWSRSREALRRLQSCLCADHDRSTAPRDLAFASAARSRPLSNPVTSLSSFFSQFDRIWRFFFFPWVLFAFLYWGINDIIYLFGNRENVRKCDWIWPDLMIFFPGFCLCFCIEEWMLLYICLATEKMWATSRKCVFYGILKNTTKHQKIFFKTFFEMQSNT